MCLGSPKGTLLRRLSLALWPLLLIVIAACGLQLWRLAHAVDEADVKAAADEVRRRWQDGDLVVATPASLMRPQAILGDLPMRQPRTLAPSMLNGFRRVHLLSIDAIFANRQAEELLEGLADASPPWRRSNVTLRTFVLHAPRRLAFDLWRDLAQVHVTAHYADGQVQPCAAWQQNRWLCPREPDWSYVGREILSIGEEARPCVWLHPLPPPGVLTVQLPKLPAGSQRRLYVGHGFSRWGARRARGPLELRVVAGDRALLVARQEVDGQWHEHVVPLVDLPPTDEGLRIEVRSLARENHASHFCAQVEVSEPW